MSDRKYRQHGYQDRGRDEERQKPSAERPVKKDTFGPRPCRCPERTAVSRCAQCGTLLQGITSRSISVQSVLSNSTPAANALTSIPPAASNAPSQSLNASRARMRAMNVRFIPCA